LDEWHALINSLMCRGSVAIKDSYDVGRYFQTKKSLRQNDPLSPMLFNIGVDMLSIMIKHARVDGLIERIILHVGYGGIPSFNIPMTQFSL
jgi:hypothetical protein